MAHLLIVDDEDYAVEGVKASLDWARLGITTISTAFNAAQARDQVAHTPPDLVLCDIEMPKESGLDFLAWIKTHHPRAEVILLTAHADFVLAQQAVRLQGFDYLVKPVADAELEKVVKRALAKLEDSAPHAVPGGPPSVGEAAAAPVIETGDVRLPEMGPWVILLKSGAREQVRREFRTHLERIRNQIHNRNVTALWNRLLLDFQQVLSAVLKSRNISAHELLSSAGAPELFRKASDSPADLVRWVDYSLDAACDRLDRLNRAETPVGLATRYINQHLGDNLTCEQVADHVAMNPDYLTRLFKKETGHSVSAFISLAKLRFAADLLSGTSLPVGEIAARIGYENPAHFSTAFKKAMGLKPSEYRVQKTPVGAVQSQRPHQK